MAIKGPKPPRWARLRKACFQKRFPPKSATGAVRRSFTRWELGSCWVEGAEQQYAVPRAVANAHWFAQPCLLSSFAMTVTMCSVSISGAKKALHILSAYLLVLPSPMRQAITLPAQMEQVAQAQLTAE